MKNQENGSDRSDDVFEESDLKNAAAAVKLTGTIVLPDKGRAGLAEGIKQVISDHSRLKAAAEAAMAFVPKLLIAAWITILAKVNTPL